MIAKVALLFAVVAAAHATTLLNPGLFAPTLLNAGIIAPGAPLLSAPIGTIPSAIATRSLIATPGAITTEKRVIGAPGLIAGAPLIYGNGIVSNGLIGAAPLAIGNGIISPIGFRSAGILAAPGVVKTILK